MDAGVAFVDAIEEEMVLARLVVMKMFVVRVLLEWLNCVCGKGKRWLLLCLP